MCQVKDQDWKLFRKKLPLWQEAYMDKLKQEYIQILSGDGQASEKFWKLEKRIRTDKRSIGVVADMRRSQMYAQLLSLLIGGVIQEHDLTGFSEELQETVKYTAQQYKEFADHI